MPGRGFFFFSWGGCKRVGEGCGERGWFAPWGWVWVGVKVRVRFRGKVRVRVQFRVGFRVEVGFRVKVRISVKIRVRVRNRVRGRSRVRVRCHHLLQSRWGSLGPQKFSPMLPTRCFFLFPWAPSLPETVA